jgi:hypothetical protein
VEEPQRAAVQAWVAGLHASELEHACFEDLPLGQWVRADVVAFHQQLDLSSLTPAIEATYRDLLTGAALLACGLPPLLQRFQPDVALLLSGSFFLHRTAFELLRQRGIRVLTHERGFFDNTLMFNENAPIWHGEQMRRRWQQWQAVPLTTAELQQLGRIMQQRRQGHNMGWTAFSPQPQPHPQVRTALNLDPQKPLALLCTSVDHEASLLELQACMPQAVWLQESLDFFAARPHWQLVVRCHPCDAQRPDYASVLKPKLQAQQQQLPQNVRLVLPDEEVSTYTLMEMAQVCLSYGSTVGLEMACLGLPVVHAGRGLYRDGGFTIEVRSREEYAQRLEEGLVRGRCREVSRRAIRFAYHYFCGLSYPMRKVRVDKDYVNAQWTFRSKVELAEGRDPELDHLVDYVLGKVELYPPPSPERLQASTQEEDQFLASQRLAAQVEAARREPDRVDLLYDVAVTLKEMGLYQDGAQTFAAVVERASDRVPALRGLGECYLHLRQYRQASSAYREAIALGATDTAVTKGLQAAESGLATG